MAAHFHVSQNTPGYLPESEDAAHPFETLSDALSCLADDLARWADDLYERLDAFKLPEDRTGEEDASEAEAMEEEGDRVHSIASAISLAARAIDGDAPALDAVSLKLEGERYGLELIATGGLSIGVEDPSEMYSLGRNFHLLPCDDSHVIVGHGAAEIQRESDGSFPSSAWPGGYTMVYLTNGGDVLCADCARESVDTGEDDAAAYAQTHDEGPAEHCANCARVLEASYGDPERA